MLFRSRTASGVTVWNTSTLQSVTGRGAVTSNAVGVTNATASTSTLTGAVVITGGLGVGGNVYAGAIYDSGSRILTTGTISVGTDTNISRSASGVTIWNTSTLQSITNRGSVTTNHEALTDMQNMRDNKSAI